MLVAELSTRSILSQAAGTVCGWGLCQNQVEPRLAEPAARWLHCVLGWRLENGDDFRSTTKTADLTCPEEVVAASVARLPCSREAQRPDP